MSLTRQEAKNDAFEEGQRSALKELGEQLEEQESEIADLKRKLSDSIAREMEVERELEEARAHADALAGALEEITQAREGWEAKRDEAYTLQDYSDYVRVEIGGAYQRCMDDVLRAVAVNHPEVETILKAYRNREETRQ